jgi:hypothetical protein
VRGRLAFESRDNVVGQGFGLLGRLYLRYEKGLHHGLGLLWGRQPLVWGAHQVRDVPPQGQVVDDLLLPQMDTLPREPQPYQGGAECVHGADTVQIVDGHAVFFDVVVLGLGPGELGDPPAHRSME